MISEAETVTAPAREPVSREEALRHGRLDGEEEGALLDLYLAAAREQVETFTRQRLITQTVRWTLPHFPAAITLPLWPVQSVSAITYVDGEGATQTLAASRYTLVASRPRRIVPAYSDVWPSTRLHPNAVQVTAVVGHGATGAAVPQALRQAIRLLAQTMFEQREGVVVGTIVSGMPGLSAVEALLRPHVLWV